jgi:hypothetical protein
VSKRFFPSLIIVSTMLASILSPLTSLAADDGKVGLAISPPTFELAANPGDTLSNKIRVDNVTEEVLNVTVDKRNFTASGEEGQAELTDEDTPYAMAKWITVSPSSVDIPPKGSQTFEYSVNVPANAEPGGHFGSIVFKTKARALQSASGIKIGQEIGSLIFLRVAGEIREGGAIETFKPHNSFYEYGPITFDSRVSNSGSVHFKPEGNITIANMFGQKVATLPLDGHNVLPGTIRKFSSDWSSKYLFGKYTATLSVKYGDKGQILTATSTFIAFPYKLVGIIVIVLIILLVITMKRRRRISKSLKILFGRD